MKMKILFCFIFGTIVSTSSCKKKSNLELSLLDKGKKWVYVNEEFYDKNLMRYGFYIDFEDDGVCYNRSFINDAPPIDIHDSSGKGNWDYQTKDSSLNIFGHEFKVLKIKNDTIFLLRKEDNWKALLVNNFSEFDSLRKANR